MEKALQNARDPILIPGAVVSVQTMSATLIVRRAIGDRALGRAIVGASTTSSSGEDKVSTII